MTLQGTQSTETITLPFRGVINDFHLLKQMLIDGAGIALLPNFLCINELATGTLVNLLPEWSLPEVDFHAIYPSQRGVTPKLRAFLALLETHLINVGHPCVHAAH